MSRRTSRPQLQEEASRIIALCLGRQVSLLGGQEGGATDGACHPLDVGGLPALFQELCSKQQLHSNYYLAATFGKTCFS